MEGSMDGPLSFRDVQPATITVQDLSVSVAAPRSTFDALKSLAGFPGTSRSPERSQKPILNNICLDMPCGSLTAILGASGSGKTSAFVDLEDPSLR